MYTESGIIYADVLFAINFAMDFLCLFIAGRINRRAGKTWRMLAAAAVGALYAFLPYLLADIPALAMLPIHLAAAALITLLAFGRGYGAKKFWLTAAAFIISAALIGGLMNAVYSATGADISGGRLRFVIIGIISAAAAIIYGLLYRTNIKTRSCEIRIYANGEKIPARLLVDTGNLVSEPFSALPVIVLSYSVLPPPLDMPESDIFPLPLRLIPYKTGGGESCLYGFLPDRIDLVTPLGAKRKVDAYIGIDVNTKAYSGYDGLMPGELV